MKRQIRQSCFETNSSSTHAICIAPSSIQYNIPSSVEFGFGEFGWSFDKLSSRQERANYLYTCLAYVEDWNKIKEYLNFIADTLHRNGVTDITFENFEISIYDEYGTIYSYIRPTDYSYVDHGDDALDFVNAVCTNESLLLDYLFSDRSFILTGNDNSGDSVEINVDYPHTEFFKGN